MLLVCAMLMIRTFHRLRMVDPGFSDASTLQTLHIAIPETSIADQRMVTRVENNIADKLAAVPGVTAVGFAAQAPMEDAGHGWSYIYAEGKTYAGDPSIRFYNYVSPGYFQALGTRLIAGRDFTWKEIYDLQYEVMVSENFAREEWGSAGAAIGKRIQQGSGLPWYQVIGVVQDLRQNGVDQKAPAIVYWPVFTAGPWHFPPRSVTFAVRSTGPVRKVSSRRSRKLSPASTLTCPWPPHSPCRRSTRNLWRALPSHSSCWELPPPWRLP